eukprot:Pgem_evm1s525
MPNKIAKSGKICQMSTKSDEISKSSNFLIGGLAWLGSYSEIISDKISKLSNFNK